MSKEEDIKKFILAISQNRYSQVAEWIENINDEDDILLVASKNYSESMMGIAKQMEFKNIIDVSKYI